MIEATPYPSLVAGMETIRDRPDATRTLGRIDVPVLVVAGELDARSIPTEMRAIADAIPGARFEVLAEVAHVSPLEDPAALGSLLRRWLRSHT